MPVHDFDFETEPGVGDAGDADAGDVADLSFSVTESATCSSAMSFKLAEFSLAATSAHSGGGDDAPESSPSGGGGGGGGDAGL